MKVYKKLGEKMVLGKSGEESKDKAKTSKGL